jgi:3-hydroxyacyl-CoA dehydrogenase
VAQVSRNIVILGSGSDAVNLALALMRPGFSTTLIEPDLGAAERAGFFLERMQKAAKAEVTQPKVSDDYQVIATADVIFDALDYPSEQRSATLLRHRRKLKEKALIATCNLDGFPSTVSPSQLVEFHLYAPAQLRRLVEITPGPHALQSTLTVAGEVARDMGREPVLAPKDLPSIGTRLLRRFYGAAETLLLQGAIPHELDEALIAFGFDLGIFEAQDLIGLDVAYGDRRRTSQPAMIYDRMVAEGRLGKYSGVGWYRYPGGGGAVIDPLLEDLIREEARFAGISPRSFSAMEMQEILVQALVDEGRAMLADGTAMIAADIDTVSIHGLGFPARLGGVMQYAGPNKGKLVS